MSLESGTVVSVSTRTSGSQLAGDHAAGSASLVVQDAIEFSEDGGTLQLGDETLSYSTYDDDTSTLSLVGVTATAHDDLDAVIVLPRTEQKTAQVVIGGRGKAVTVRVQHAQYTTLAQGIKDPSRVKSVYLYWDGDEYVIEDIIGWDGDDEGDGVDPGLIAYPTYTNLCTDPQPVNPLTWTDNTNPSLGGGPVADTTYPGLTFRIDPNTFFGYGVPFTLPSTGPLAAIVPDPISGTKLMPLDQGDLTIAFNARNANTLKLYAILSLFDAAGASLGVTANAAAAYIVGGTDSTYLVAYGAWGQTYPAGTIVRSTWGLDVAGILAAYPTAAYAGIRFSSGMPIINNSMNTATWLGHAAIYAGADLNTPYRDGDSADWTSNSDGTSSGRIDLNAIPSWQDLVGTQPPPIPHQHVAADVTDLATVVKGYHLNEFATPTADVPFNSKKITGLADGTSAQHAATKNQVDTSTVQLTATFQPANNAAMTGLSAKKGDIAKKVDDGLTYVLTALPASTLGNWLAIGGGGGGGSDSGVAGYINDTTPSLTRAALDALYASSGTTRTVIGQFPLWELATQTTTSASQQTFGDEFICQSNATITEMKILRSYVSGRTYRFSCWELNGVVLGAEIGHIDVIPGSTAATPVSLSSGTVSWPMVADQKYLFAMTDTVGGNLGIKFSNGAGPVSTMNLAGVGCILQEYITCAVTLATGVTVTKNATNVVAFAVKATL